MQIISLEGLVVGDDHLGDYQDLVCLNRQVGDLIKATGDVV